MQRTLIAVVLCLGLMAGLAACGGSDGGGGGNNGGGGGGGSGLGTTGTPVSEDARDAALQAVADQFASLPTADPAANLPALVTFLRSRPEFEDAGASSDLCAWARFTDGRMLIVAANLPPPTSEDQPSPPADRSTSGGRAQGTNQPVSKQARCLNAMGIGYQRNNLAIEGLLRDAGYDVVASDGVPGDAEASFASVKDATLEALREVSGDGVFYFTSHGGHGKVRDGREMYAVWSATVRSRARDRELAAELNDGSLTYFVAYDDVLPNGDATTPCKYAVTPLWVQRYWQFSPDSLVFINACTSDDDFMKGACLAQGGSLYAGWTRPSGVPEIYSIARFLISRLAGLRDLSLTIGAAFDLERPDQRPFDYEPVLENMHARGLDHTTRPEPYGVAQLVLTAGYGEFGLLRPSIGGVGTYETKNELHLGGLFGDDPGAEGQVTVGGQALTVKSWEGGSIVCDIPASGPGSAGDVQVTVRGLASNVRQLTEWRIPFHSVLRDQGTLTETMDFIMHWRGDVGTARAKPGEAPSPSAFRFLEAADSAGRHELSGEWVDTSGGGTFTETWSGGGELVSGRLGVTGSGYLVAEGGFHDQVFEVSLTASGEGGTNHQVQRTSDGEVVSEHTSTGGHGLRYGGGYIPLQMTPDWTIRAGSRDWTTSGLHGGDTVTTMHLEWSATPAAYPPDPNAARAVRRPTPAARRGKDSDR